MINCDLINLSICLTDLEHDNFSIANNGKKYLNISIETRKDTDKYGNDLTVKYKKKQKGDLTKYVKGSAGKTVTFNNSNNSNGSNNSISEPVKTNVYTDDSLPF